MVLFDIIMEVTDTTVIDPTDYRWNNSTFFGYLGVACALVFASTYLSSQ